MPSPVAPVKLQQLGTHWPREAVSVLLPGSVLAIELVAIGNPRLLRDLGLVKLNGATTAALAVMIVAAAVIVGYTSRSLTFRLFGLFWKPPWDNHEYAPESLKHLRKLFSNDVIRRGLADSPIVASWQPTLTLQNGYWLYCKYWLRINAPALAVDDVETDINISYAFVPPVLLGGPAVVHAMSMLTGGGFAPWWAYAVALVVAVGPAAALADKGRRKQRDETLAGLDRYLIARLMTEDTPPARLVGRAQEEDD